MSNLLLDLCTKWKPFGSDEFVERLPRNSDRRNARPAPCEMPYSVGEAGMTGFNSWAVGSFDDDVGDDFDDITGC